MARPRKPTAAHDPEPTPSLLGPPIAFDPAAVDALLGGRTTMAELDELFRQMKKALMGAGVGRRAHASLGLRARRAQARGAAESS